MYYLFTFGRSGSSVLHGLFSSWGEWARASFGAAASSVAAGPALNLGLGHAGCSDCSFLAPELGSAAAAWSLVAAWFVGSSRTRDQTWVSCVGRWILYHWAIKEALKIMLIFFFFPPSVSSFPTVLLGPILFGFSSLYWLYHFKICFAFYFIQCIIAIILCSLIF